MIVVSFFVKKYIIKKILQISYIAVMKSIRKELFNILFTLFSTLMEQGRLSRRKILDN